MAKITADLSKADHKKFLFIKGVFGIRTNSAVVIKMIEKMIPIARNQVNKAQNFKK